ncbi:MAG: GldM family protein [Bacteroidia bacterium]|nr:GldM family protein [Bacteroidia bacterium]
MASGKQSPRQKMINMMYLVLIAMLAMNVSAEILNAFENIRKKLNTSANTALTGSKSFISSMKEEIDNEVKNENKTTNLLLKDTLDDIQTETSKIIALLDRHSTVLRDSISGVEDGTGELKKKDDTEHNLQYWMGRGAEQEANGGRGAGEAYRLHQTLDKYSKFLFDIYQSQIKDPAAKSALKVEDWYVALDPDKSQTHGKEAKTWEQYVFEGPLIANMAQLESIKLDVYEKEKELLNQLNERLGVATFKVDKVIGVNAPMATIVPAGLQFQTRLFVSMSSAQIRPTYTSGSGSIKMEDDGSAILTVGASGGVIGADKAEGKQRYSATISVPKATGGNEVIPVEGEFTVRRPEIVVTSAAIQILYASCGNDVNIDVPALGDLYDPVFAVSSGQVIKSSTNKKRVRLVPTGKECIVTVSSNTNGQTLKIGDVKYKVIQPPKPGVNMAVNGKPYNGSAMVPKSSRVQVRIEPDADFASGLPEDANYGITSIEVLAQLSLGPPTPINRINSAGQDATKAIAVALGSRISEARAGTKVYVKLNDIYRVNFKKERIVDPRFSEVERTLSLVVE